MSNLVATAQIKLRDANLNTRVLANRFDLQVEPGIIVTQTPQAVERVDCGSTSAGRTRTYRTEDSEARDTMEIKGAPSLVRLRCGAPRLILRGI